MSNTRGPGTVSGTTKPDLYYFDKLPPKARRALAMADFDWSSGAVYQKWNKGKSGWKTGEQVAKKIKEWDAWAKKQTSPNGR